MRRRVKFIASLVSSAIAISTLSACSEWLDDRVSDGKQYISVIQDKGGEIISIVGDKVDSFVDVAGDKMTDIWDNIQDGAKTGMNSVSEWFHSTVDSTVRVYNDISRNVKSFTDTTVNKAGEFYTSAKDGVISFYNKTTKPITITEQPSITADAYKYVGDNETLVYSLISTELSKKYQVFNASVIDPSTGKRIEGYAYTDKSEAIQEEDNPENIYYSAGFVGAVEEDQLNIIDEDVPLEITRADLSEDETKYFRGFSVNPFRSHFIANNKYVIFGIGEDGNMIFDEYLNYSYNYDNELGGLYNFDTKKWVRGTSNQYLNTSGLVSDSFLNSGDISSAVIQEFGSFKFSLTPDEIINCISNVATTVKEKITEIMDKLSSDTFLGFTKEELFKDIDTVNASEIVDVEADSIDLQSTEDLDPENEPSDLVKGLIIAGVAVAFIATIVVALFCSQYKALIGIFGAILGAAIELMVQTVFEKTSFADINWLKIGLAALAGFISAFCGPIGDAVVSGLTSGIFTFMDGGSLLESAISFIKAFVIALIVVGIFKVLGKIAHKVAPKLCEKFSSFVANHQVTFFKGSKFISVGAVDDVARGTLGSRAIGKAANSASDSADDVKSAIRAKQIDAMVADKNTNFGKVDSFGNPVTKSDLRKAGSATCDIVLKDTASDSLKEACDAFGVKPGETVCKSIDGSSTTFNSKLVPTEFDMPEGVIGKGKTRGPTMTQARNTLAEIYNNDPASIPTQFKSYFDANDILEGEVTGRQIQDAMSSLGYTFHESSLTHIQVVPTEVHAALSHAGGHSFGKLTAALGNLTVLFPVIN